MLRAEFIQRKIKLIQEDLGKLEELASFSFKEIDKDPIRYSAAERYLERIVTRAIDINRHCLAEIGKGNEVTRTYEDTFLRLADLGVYPLDFAQQIAPSAGLRNMLVHEYDGIDSRIVYDSIKTALVQYIRYCDYLFAFLENRRKT